METLHSLSRLKPESKGPWKGLGLGALGLGFACIGCCLAPLAGVFLATGAGAGIAGLFFSNPLLLGILGGTLALLGFWVWKSRQVSCCTSGGAGCGNRGCGIRKPEAETKGAGV